MTLPTPDWQSDCGRVVLYQGDCLSLLPHLAPGRVDAVVTDPPYGIGLRNGDVDGHRSDRWDAIAGDHNQDAGENAIGWAHVWGVTVVAFASPWKPWPGKWRNLIAWNKGGAVGGGGDIKTCLKRTWELIQVYNRGPMVGDRDESVWNHPMIPADTSDHIAAKPVSLMKRLVERFTAEDCTILDPFMGSGTTGVACVKTGRKFIGIELEPKYFEIAKRRIREELEANLFLNA